MTVRAPWLSRLLIAVSLASAALVPLLNPQLPRSADGRPHLFRIILLDNAVRNGEWWPRYSPELAYGNGYPLFNFYAPLTYYLGVALHGLGLDFVPALHAIFTLTLIIGAWGAFTLAAEWFGEWAGGVAAAAFVFAPYTLFNTLTRGAAPEALAVALLPWLLWSLHHAMRAPSAPALLRLSLLYAALLLTHNLTALIGTGLLGVWLVVEIVTARPHVLRFTRPLSLVTLSLLSGLALAAFFWLPALIETSAVQVAQLTAPATLDFRNYFLSVAQLFTPTFTFDPRLEPVSVPVSFGVVNTAFAVLALLLWRHYPNHITRWRIAALGGLCAVFLFMTLPVSQPVWEAVGALRVIQFPWRFLGPASVCAALLCGAAVAELGERVARWLSPVFIVLLALLAFPWTFVTRYSEIQLPVTPHVTDIFEYEVESGGFGLTSTGEFLPVGVQVLPTPDAARAIAAAQGALERLEVASLPASVTVLESNSARLTADAHFQSLQPFTATFQWFDFPGWQAEVDGQRVEIAPSEPHGFITLPVPAGEHSVRVFFSTTPVRQIAAALTALGAAGLIVLLIVARRRESPIIPPSPSRFTYHGSLAAVGLSLALFRFAIDARDTPFRQSRFDGQNVTGAEQSLDVNFGDALRLVAFDPPPPTPADRPLAFTLYWTQFDVVNANYSIAAQLWDEEGHLIGQQDSQHPNGAPTTRWLAGDYAADRHALTPYPGAPPGEYRLMIGVYPKGGALRGANVEVKNAAGLPLGRFFEAARVTVLPPTQPATVESLNPAQIVRAPLGPIELIGVDGLRPNVTAGDDLPLVLYYRVNETLIPNTFLQLDLRGADAGEAKLRTLTPMSAVTISGDAGAVVRLNWTFLIPARTPAGDAEVQASVYARNAALSRGRIAGPVSLGNVTVAVPPRSFVTPPMPSTVNARFGSAIELLGFEMTGTPRPGEPLALTLYWQSHEAVAARYTVFVHVLDADGNIVAQTDALPAQGARPTTGWLPPEIITDTHSIPIAPNLRAGEYLVQVGLYDPRTGVRLKAPGPDGNEQRDAVVLGRVELP